jgi:hypothetical protein
MGPSGPALRRAPFQEKRARCSASAAQDQGRIPPGATDTQLALAEPISRRCRRLPCSLAQGPGDGVYAEALKDIPSRALGLNLTAS